MHNFYEDLLQFIWKHRLLKPQNLTSVSGKEISIIHPGDLNRDSGPDFSNAKIKLDGLLLAGNIEIHIKTSDWLKHAHQFDRSYDNIILHAVYEHDLELEQNKTFNVEVLELKELISEQVLDVYAELAASVGALACEKQLSSVDDFKFSAWLQRMTVERLEQKVKMVEAIFEECRGDFAQTFYILLCKSFGFKVNVLPFELLGRHLPIHTLLRLADDQTRAEALLLGMSGFLEGQLQDPYMSKLQNEFEFQKRKLGLVPLQKKIFKFSKMRPANFPTLRLVQLAALIHQHPQLFNATQYLTDFAELDKALQVKLSPYWSRHYNADTGPLDYDLTLGKQSRQSLLINAFAPFFFFYGKRLNKEEYKESALSLLGFCETEDNVKVRHFRSKSRQIKDAACSQGLIHLHDQYCSKRKCLNCGIAAAMLQRDLVPVS